MNTIDTVDMIDIIDMIDNWHDRHNDTFEFFLFLHKPILINKNGQHFGYWWNRRRFIGTRSTFYWQLHYRQSYYWQVHFTDFNLLKIITLPTIILLILLLPYRQVHFILLYNFYKYMRMSTYYYRLLVHLLQINFTLFQKPRARPKKEIY